MNENITYENRQIYRIDGKNCFLEINRHYDTGKGKIGLLFAQYDPEQGNRMTAKVNCFLDVPEFLYLSHIIQSGIPTQYAKEATSRNQTVTLYENLGGTSAKRLATQNRTRTDNKSESRRLTIRNGSKADFYISAESGAGEESATGLIVPAYGRNPEVRIGLPVTNKEMLKMVLTVQMEIQAWQCAKFTKINAKVDG
ncbi:MAG: hypothetical protein Q4C04_05620 [Clostridia bacterium]|nr:hypothetical protein [Clostridia bacterium]